MLYASPAKAQSVIDGFAPDVNDQVMVMAVQPDGMILIGGDFVTIDGQPQARLARLYPDGSLDAGFAPQVNATVAAIQVQPDGHILIGGNFTQVNGEWRHFIARLDENGMLDGGFVPEANQFVEAFALQADGKILVGGAFTEIGGQAQRFLARLHPDGTLDSAFFPEVGFLDSPAPWPIHDYVESIVLQPDGKILIGGVFGQVNGVSQENIARLHSNGLLDALFFGNANGPVKTILLQPNGKILLAGRFTEVNWVARRGIARLGSYGGLDMEFNPDILDEVDAMAFQPDGRIIVAGRRGTQTPPVDIVARVTNNGWRDLFFMEFVVDDAVNHIALQNDGKILIGGLFASADGLPRSRLARIYKNGSMDAVFNPGADHTIFALALQPDQKVLVGGNFDQVAGVPREGLARLLPDGRFDGTFASGSVDGHVYGIATQADGQVLLGGTFTQVDGHGSTRLARVDAGGGLDSSFNPAPNSWVRPIIVLTDTKILVGGAFTQIADQSQPYLARLNATGTLDAKFTPKFDGRVLAMALADDQSLLVGGLFNNVNDVPHARLVRLDKDGKPDTGFAPSSTGGVYAIAVQGEKIVVGGSFMIFNGEARANLVRLNADGSTDHAFAVQTNGSVKTIVLQTDGSILIGGDFTQVAGLPRQRLALINEDGTLNMDFTTGTDEDVEALALQSDGKVLVGGAFAQVGGQPRNRLARITGRSLAAQLLDFEEMQGNIDWKFVGSSPWLWYTYFEVNNVTARASAAAEDGYTYLGTGTRTADGWQLSGQLLPVNQDVWIRARGFYGTGANNGSTSLVESEYMVFIPPPPGVITLTATVDGGSASATDWTYGLVGGPSDIEAGEAITLAVGAYVVTTVGPPGYEVADAQGVCTREDDEIVLTVAGNGGLCTVTQRWTGSTIRVLKQVDGVASADLFTFTSDIPTMQQFQIGHDEVQESGLVTATTYTVVESDPTPLTLVAIRCSDTDGETEVDLVSRSVVIDLDIGEAVECTFVNGIKQDEKCFLPLIEVK